MKKLLAILVVGMALANIGCVPSLHPFFLEGDVVFDKCLVGKWVDRDFRFTWYFDRRGYRAYRLTQVDEDGDATIFEATLFKLNGRTFLDVAAIIDKDKYGTSLLRGHSLIAISIENERLRISTLEPTWVRDQLTRSPTLLRHTFFDNETVITDMTENIQSFIRKSMNAPGAFGAVEEVFKQGETK